MFVITASPNNVGPTTESEDKRSTSQNETSQKTSASSWPCSVAHPNTQTYILLRLQARLLFLRALKYSTSRPLVALNNFAGQLGLDQSESARRALLAGRRWVTAEQITRSLASLAQGQLVFGGRFFWDVPVTSDDWCLLRGGVGDGAGTVSARLKATRGWTSRGLVIFVLGTRCLWCHW